MISILRISGLVLLGVIFCGAALSDDDSLSIGQAFHWMTGFDESGFRGEPTFGEKIPVYKTYRKAKRISLPAPSASTASVEEAIRERRSHRYFLDEPMSLTQLSAVLLAANGITGKGTVDLRAAPSGGALYPVDLYAVVHDIDGLQPGLYHFQVSDSSLELLRSGDFADKIHVAANEQDAIGGSPVTLIMAARFDRSTQKYADRGYRYTYIEAGAICENIYLVATALGLGTVAVGSFNDAEVNAFLEVDGLHEAALLLMPVGHPR